MPVRLIGRRSELATLISALERARRGLGSAVFVVGEPGMGKTTLVTAALEGVDERSVQTAWGSGWEAGGSPALWPWIQVLRRLGAPAELLARVAGAGSPVSANADPDGGRFRMFDDLCEFLLDADADADDRGGRIRVIVLEDVHWADPGTLTLLELIGSRVRDRRVLLIATYRAEELPRVVVRDLAGHGEVISLVGLDRADVAALLADQAGAEMEAGRIDAVWEGTGGNPLFVRELARLVKISGDTRGPVPEGIRQVLDRRFARLPQPVVELLEVVAVAGPLAGLDLAAGVRGLPAGEALDLVDQAAAAGVVAVDPAGRVHFAHDLFRATLLVGVGDRRRQELHLAIGQALAAQSTDPTGLDAAMIADHFGQALALGGAADACRYATMAAERAAAQLAHDAAHDWYSRALAALDVCAPRDDGRRIELLVSQADAARRSGSVAGSRAALAGAVELIRATGHQDRLADVALACARIGGLSGMSDPSTGDLLTEALAALEPPETFWGASPAHAQAMLPRKTSPGPAPPGPGRAARPGARDEIRARLLAALARDEYHHGEGVRDPVAIAAEAVELARGGPRSTLSFCLTAQHDASWQPGSAAQRLVLADEIATLADRSGDVDARVEAELLRYAARFELGDPRADESFQRYAHSAACPANLGIATSSPAGGRCRPSSPAGSTTRSG